MPIDYRRLVDGLGTVTEMVGEGRAGLAAVDHAITAAWQATRALGGTYTEYGEEGGRVVVAGGALAWALGQPIGPEFVDRDLPAQPWVSRVDVLPVELAEPLQTRGVVALAGHPVHAAGRLVGAVHLYLGEVDFDALAELDPVLRLLATSVAHVCGGELPSPTTTETGDDRALFLAVAGHELRTPVTVVKGYASMLANRWDALDEPNRREAAQVITQRADELARLVDRLLGASVGDTAAGWLVHTVPFDPIEALSRAAAELPAELRRRLRLELPNSLPPASGDPAILTSIVAELVTNAVRNTPAGSADESSESPDGVEVHAGADTHTVYVRVCDRGTGIDPADVERAFERFWRSHRGDGHGGVGLGLYLVRRLVERQNGWVSLRPRDGGGTVAEVRLPRADRPDAPDTGRRVA
jgi:two-component system, OmpR family, phosphate regulon sensor histidine kinase PhoR